MLLLGIRARMAGREGPSFEPESLQSVRFTPRLESVGGHPGNRGNRSNLTGGAAFMADRLSSVGDRLSKVEGSAVEYVRRQYYGVRT